MAQDEQILSVMVGVQGKLVPVVFFFGLLFSTTYGHEDIVKVDINLASPPHRVGGFFSPGLVTRTNPTGWVGTDRESTSCLSSG